MSDMSEDQVLILVSPEALAAEAADRFVSLAREAIATHGRFSVALSGGSTPEALHRLLALPPRKSQVDWANVYVFWGDERFVPPDAPDSSRRMAEETLLNHVPIPAANVYPVPTVGLSPAAAARQYSRSLANFFAPAAIRFDLIFLGMGTDGHTASLFPGQTAVTKPDGQPVAVVVNAPKPPPIRLTFTYQIINQAANVIFLVAGSGKAQTVAKVLAQECDSVQCPAAGVKLRNGRMLWLLDKEAAQALPPAIHPYP
jgi:6-phosphogluconolactonase